MDIGSLFGGGGLVALILATGGGIRWWVKRHDDKLDPIPKSEAAMALAQSGVALMQGVADELREEMSRVKADAASQGDTLRTEVDGLRGDVQHLRLTLTAAARYIERLLRWAKSDTRPPIPPLPSDLRDLIDPSLHD